MGAAVGAGQTPESDRDILALASARVGTVLRRKYTLDRVLGIGGMAVVYAATHRNKKQFAVKVLLRELSHRADLRTRFLREGYVANSVEHPGAVVVLDDDVAEDGSAFLVMELLQGASLEELVQRLGHRLPIEALLAIADQVLDVLGAAHMRGIVHRDIKPANLFLTNEGQIKVLDFGIARLRDAASSDSTNTGEVMGTPAFMSPEQALAKGGDIDAQSDLWAVGAVLFALASGRAVHEADNGQQVLIKAATLPAPSLATVLPGAHPEFVYFVDRALAFDKSERWPSAALMRAALGGISGRVPPGARSQETLVRLLTGDIVGGSDAPPPAISAPLVARREQDEQSTLPPPGPGTMAAPAATSPALAALATAQRIFRDAGAGFASRRRIIALLAGGGGLLVAGVVALLLFGMQRGGAPPTAVVTLHAAPGVVSAETAALPAPAPAAPTPPATAPSSSNSERPMTSVDPLSQAQGPRAWKAYPSPSPAALAPRPAPAAVPLREAAPTPTPARSASTHDCALPFYFDAQGNKKWKLQCL